ncbi:MAG: ATP-dependent Clp protease ATP-binding subunit, partial [Clostridia bacterium]|nr:ATP-dependent Clp protease ATP-binding subunit [Clostridia bacterium]
LARGELQTIGATTLEEYRKYIEQDSALERRFTPVLVEEPSVEDTVTILQGIKGKYEAHHNIIITDEAIEAAARLSDRYITDRFLPDKAIDLLDEAASRMRLNSFNGPAELRETADKIKRLKTEYTNALKWEDTARADELSVKIGKLSAELQKLQAAWDEKRSFTHLSIGAEEVAEIVGARTGIPVSRLTEEESDRLLNLEEELHERIVGQDEAVSAVARAIRRARAGLKDPNRPVGSFIFVGPTGVGKTDLSKALAVSMFGDEDLLIRLDMSEYMSKESVNKMIGTAPGYVGFEEAGQLTERVRRKPYSVVLFDEIEKAHPDVFNILLQILDDGRLTDNRGRVVSFKNTIIILTSNVGAHEVKEVATLGFRSSDEESAYADMRERIQTALKARFKPEFLNRLDETVVFHKLSKENAAKICDKILGGLVKRMRERGISLEITQEAKNNRVELGYSEEYRARPLKRTVQREVEDLLSEAVLTGEVRQGSTAVLDVQSGIFTVNAE